MKHGLILGLLVGMVTLAPKSVVADFNVRVTTTRDSVSVPVGDVVLTVEGATGNNLNTGGQVGTFHWNSLTPVDVRVRAIPLAIRISVDNTSTVEGSDLIVHSTFRPQTIVQSYSRTDSGGVPLPANPPDNFTVNRNFNIDVNFALAPGSSAKEYQFYFGDNEAPAEDAQPPFSNSPDFVSTNPQSTTVIPWSVIQHMGTGNNLYAVLRVVDFQDRVHNGSFQFDVTPMGGGAAIPEPSTWWAVGLVASCYSGRVAWRKWRKRRKIEVL